MAQRAENKTMLGWHVAGVRGTVAGKNAEDPYESFPASVAPTSLLCARERRIPFLVKTCLFWNKLLDTCFHNGHVSNGEGQGTIRYQMELESTSTTNVI